MEITAPLRLAKGSHKAGSGRGCAMNVISWENGDTKITDFPACSDRLLASIVQRVNDSICTHSKDLLCAECSVKVLQLGHRTVGTGEIRPTGTERRQVWVAIAADQARQVLHLVAPADMDTARRCIEAAESWATDPSDTNCFAAQTARADATYAAFAAAVYAAAAATYAVTDAAAATYAATYAALTTTAAATTTTAFKAAGKPSRLSLAHRAIDLFESLTKHVASPVPVEITERAIARMSEKEPALVH